MRSDVYICPEKNLVYVKFYGSYRGNDMSKTLEATLNHPSYHTSMNSIADLRGVDLSLFNFVRAASAALKLLKNVEKIGDGMTVFLTDGSTAIGLAKMFMQTLSALEKQSDKKVAHTWLKTTNIEVALEYVNLPPDTSFDNADITLGINEQKAVAL